MGPTNNKVSFHHIDIIKENEFESEIFRNKICVLVVGERKEKLQLGQENVTRQLGNFFCLASTRVQISRCDVFHVNVTSLIAPKNYLNKKKIEFPTKFCSAPARIDLFEFKDRKKKRIKIEKNSGRY